MLIVYFRYSIIRQFIWCINFTIDNVDLNARSSLFHRKTNKEQSGFIGESKEVIRLKVKKNWSPVEARTPQYIVDIQLNNPGVWDAASVGRGYEWLAFKPKIGDALVV